MYFKCLDNQGHWHWISDVTNISKYADFDEIPDWNGLPAPKRIGAQGDENSKSYIIRLQSPKGEEIFEVFGVKGYLCNDETGATLDTVIP